MTKFVPMFIRQLNLLWLSKDKIDKVDVCNGYLFIFKFFLQKKDKLAISKRYILRSPKNSLDEVTSWSELDSLWIMDTRYSDQKRLTIKMLYPFIGTVTLIFSKCSINGALIIRQQGTDIKWHQIDRNLSKFKTIITNSPKIISIFPGNVITNSHMFANCLYNRVIY